MIMSFFKLIAKLLFSGDNEKESKPKIYEEEQEEEQTHELQNEAPIVSHKNVLLKNLNNTQNQNLTIRR